MVGFGVLERQFINRITPIKTILLRNTKKLLHAKYARIIILILYIFKLLASLQMEP